MRYYGSLSKIYVTYGIYGTRTFIFSSSLGNGAEHQSASSGATRFRRCLFPWKIFPSLVVGGRKFRFGVNVQNLVAVFSQYDDATKSVLLFEWFVKDIFQNFTSCGVLVGNRWPRCRNMVQVLKQESKRRVRKNNENGLSDLSICK